LAFESFIYDFHLYKLQVYRRIHYIVITAHIHAQGMDRKKHISNCFRVNSYIYAWYNVGL